jgi:hypothetical protein
MLVDLSHTVCVILTLIGVISIIALGSHFEEQRLLKGKNYPQWFIFYSVFVIANAFLFLLVPATIMFIFSLLIVFSSVGI